MRLISFAHADVICDLFDRPLDLHCCAFLYTFSLKIGGGGAAANLQAYYIDVHINNGKEILHTHVQH